MNKCSLHQLGVPLFSMGNKRESISVQQKTLQILEQYPNKSFTYKQVAARLGIHDPSGRNHITKGLKN